MMLIKTTLERFFTYAPSILLIGIMSLLLYGNLGPKQDFSILLPLELLKNAGVNQSFIITIKKNSDKIAHFFAGLIYTILFFFTFRPFKIFNTLFYKNISPVIFLFLTSLAELAQYLFRVIACEITHTCNSNYFSFLDISAGFAGCITSLFCLWFIKHCNKEKLAIKS